MNGALNLARIEDDPLLAQLKDLRLLLRGAGRSEEGATLFSTLYRSWCHSLGAVLSLCFLAEVCAQALVLCKQPLDLGSKGL